MALLSTIETTTLILILLVFSISCGLVNGVNIHGIGVMLLNTLLLIVVLTPCEWICVWMVLLKWGCFFKGLNLKPVTTMLLSTLNPLWEVLWRILKDAS
jgi:hypothetical protein